MVMEKNQIKTNECSNLIKDAINKDDWVEPGIKIIKTTAKL